jgi:hypothetical protein
MAKKRDFISDILDRKSRHHKRTQRWLQLMKRVEALIYSLNHVVKQVPRKHSVQAELLRYIPIGIIAASEGYFRLVYRDLIDFGDPYLRNAASFKELSLGHDAIYAIHGRRTTVGEIIAHQLSHNSMGDISKNMDYITGGGLMAAIEQQLDVARIAWVNTPEDATRASWVFRNVVRTFELRHIFCHELATIITPNRSEIDACLRATVAFLYCSEVYISNLIKRHH